MYLFRAELRVIQQLLLWFVSFFGDEPVEPPRVEALLAIVFSVAIWVSALLFGLALSTSAVLPTKTFSQRYFAFERIARFLTKSHGTAMIIREALDIHKPAPEPVYDEDLDEDEYYEAYEIVPEQPEVESGWRSRQPGVVLLDASSAALIVGGVHRKPAVLPTEYSLSRERRIQRPTGISGPRVHGAGLVFTESGEKVIGIADLRKQFRMLPGVEAYTRDGIGVKSRVFSIFTLGQQSDVLKVTILDPDDPESVRGVRVDADSRIVKGFYEIPDKADREEIYRVFKRVWPSSEQPYRLEPDSRGTDSPPYLLDPSRIQKALLRQARKVKNGEEIPWTDLPLQVGVDIYRDVIIRNDYDGLYMPQAPNRSPLNDEIRPLFVQLMKHQGVLSYQLLQRLDREPLENDQEVNWDKVWVSPEFELMNPKLLRERGIKVVHAGFSEPTPIREEVIQQRLEQWRSHWKAIAELARLDFEQEIHAVRNEARAEAQREMVFRLKDLLNQSPHAEEALAVRIFQALESTAENPETRKLLPQETISMLRTLRDWLLDDEDGNLLPPDGGKGI